MQTIEPIASGKTKDIIRLNLVRVRSRNDITAGDGKKHDVIPGKGVISTETTSNIFALLKEFNTPLAFVIRDEKDSFLAEECSMIPLEVVWRAEAHGSALERNPKLVRGEPFAKPITELYLKTKTPTFRGRVLPANDPLLRFYRGEVLIHDPHARYIPREPALRFSEKDFFASAQRMMHRPKPFDLLTINEARRITKRVGIILQTAFAQTAFRLVDFKVEFGITSSGRLVLSDVIDNDSWRLVDGATNMYVDKQVYRDGGNLEQVLLNYQLVADLTGQFAHPLFRRKLKENFS